MSATPTLDELIRRVEPGATADQARAADRLERAFAELPNAACVTFGLAVIAVAVRAVSERLPIDELWPAVAAAAPMLLRSQAVVTPEHASIADRIVNLEERRRRP